jgi:hypothetical protein
MFNEEPRIKIDFHNKKRPYRLMNTVIFEHEDIKFVIHRGYNYDGATIPRFFYRIIGSKGEIEFLKPALVHDWMCEHKKKFSNKEASEIFTQLLIHYGVNKLKAFIMGYCVYLWQQVCGGWKNDD